MLRWIGFENVVILDGGLSTCKKGGLKTVSEPDELDAMHSGDKSKRHITYFNAGALASVDAFTLVRLGYEDVGLVNFQ